MDMLSSRIVSVWVLLMAMLGGSVPPAHGTAADTSATKYWIFFAARSAPDTQPAPITARAAERRRLRGTVSAPGWDQPPPAACLQRLRDRTIHPIVLSRWLNAASAHLTRSQRAAAAALDCVRSIQPVARSALQQQPRSPLLNAPLAYGPSEQQLALINATAPLARGINGAGVRIGFLDTEYGAFMHPVFDSLRAQGRVIATRNFTGRTQNNRHGRSVASVAVGHAPGALVGPAHGAEVLAATTEYVGFERNVEEDYFVAGLEWLEAQGADVVNISLGYTRFDDGEASYSTDELDGDTAVTTRAVDRAASLGVLVVVSAGNEGFCSRPANCWFYISTPADADSALAVGAVDPDSVRSPFSSYGPTADGRIKPDVAAPGRSVRVASSNGRYRSGSGTSFASPLVTGVAAQMLQVNPNLAPMDVRRILRETSSQATRPDSILGWGIINADAAIQHAEALAQPPPPELSLSAPFPNPARQQTTFEIDVPEGGRQIEMRLYNVMGQLLRMRTADLNAGTHRLSFDVQSLASGLYLYTIEGRDLRHTGKVTVIR